MSIASFIAKTSENPNFIAWNAHMFFAAFVVRLFPSVIPRYISACVLILLAAGKEFVFDRLHEKTPPQNFWNDLEDFAGYCSGVILGLLI
ncbi:MAG: hypothetical protein KGL39_14075 [Patescibacteria group bacterium]|nr:hypothetical protein [Patescibacteria group bacterium]